MRAYLAYNNTGIFTGVILPFDYPEDYDILNEDPQHPIAKDHYAVQSEREGFVGFVPFDCECDTLGCDCVCIATYTHYVDANGNLREKPPLTLKIDGAVVDSPVAPVVMPPQTPKAPGSTFTVTVEADVPDGTSTTLTLNGARMSLNPPTLVFSNGSASCSLVAPAQGMIGSAVGIGKLLKPIRVVVVGWSS